jgi:hypothetical protein
MGLRSADAIPRRRKTTSLPIPSPDRIPETRFQKGIEAADVGAHAEMGSCLSAISKEKQRLPRAE